MSPKSQCPQCGSKSAANRIGSLGRAPAYRCRGCGWTWTAPAASSSSNADKLASAQRLLAAMPINHPHRAALEAAAARYAA